MREQLTRPQSQDRARWIEILDHVSPEVLTERFVDQVRNIEDYDDPSVTWAEIRSSALNSFVVLLETLKDGRGDRMLEIATHVGVTRARARIPMSSLMNAIRLDFQILWNSILEVSEDGDAQLLIRHANVVWMIVDDYVRQTQDAYIAERRRMEEEVGSVRRKLLAELLRSEELSPHRLEFIAESLGISADSAYFVAAADEDEGAITALRTEMGRLERSSLTPFAQYRDTSLIMFFELPAAPTAAQQRAIDSMLRLPIGVIERAEGVTELRHAVPLAVQLAGLSGQLDNTAVTPARGWTKLIHDRVHDLNLVTFLDVHPQLSACGQAERANLLAAVRAYLETGSTSEAAEATFCHRNTLTNRLQRFRELTGIDVTVPKEAALLVVLWG